MDFNERLNQASNKINEQMRQEKANAEAERQAEAAAANAREEASNKSHAVAAAFVRDHVEPVVKALQERIPGGIREGHGARQTKMMRQALKYGVPDGGEENITFFIYFDEDGIELALHVICTGEGVAHNASFGRKSAASFDAQAAKKWIEDQAITAYEVFGKQSYAMRHPPATVTYKGGNP